MGNSKVNAILEADRRKAGLTAPEPTSSRPDKEAWIKAKYQDLAMVVALDNPDVVPRFVFSRSLNRVLL